MIVEPPQTGPYTDFNYGDCIFSSGEDGLCEVVRMVDDTKVVFNFATGQQRLPGETVIFTLMPNAKVVAEPTS